jgi:hypothetical protein
MVDFHAGGTDVNTEAAVVPEATLVPEARSRVADNHWASPPEPINQILDAPSTPAMLISPDNQWFVELEQPSLPSIAELAEPKIAVAGLRLNPRLNSPARHHTYRSMTLHAIESGVSKPIPCLMRRGSAMYAGRSMGKNSRLC